MVPLWVKRASGPKSWVRVRANSHPQLPTSLMVIYQQIPKDKSRGSPVKGQKNCVPVLLWFYILCWLSNHRQGFTWSSTSHNPYYDVLNSSALKNALCTEQNKMIHSQTPWSRVFFKEPLAAQPAKKFSSFYRTQSFINVFTECTTKLYPQPNESSLNLHTM